jgi:uncharacterized protein
VEVALLCFFSFLAGFIDSVVGGGGLIQLPALLLALPSEPLPRVFGTNKFPSICGTGFAVFQYARRVRIQWRLLLPAAGAAFLFSFIGARAVTFFRRETLEPVILFLMVAVAGYTFAKKDFGNLHAPRLSPGAARAVALAVGMVIGFYDGFFGPGTGSFLIFIFIGLFGFDFLNASAHAKVINFSTNMAAVGYFALTDNIFYKFALPMAVFNILGSLTGTKMAILKGNRFVRTLFLFVVGAMIVRYGYEVFRR